MRDCRAGRRTGAPGIPSGSFSQRHRNRGGSCVSQGAAVQAHAADAPLLLPGVAEPQRSAPFSHAIGRTEGLPALGRARRMRLLQADLHPDAPDVIRLVAEVPGVRPEDVKISVEGNLLTITGTKEQVAQEKAEKVHRYERTYGAFERTFRLSASIDPKKIKATYDLGVLTITLPKAETAKPHLIEVEVTQQKAVELTPLKALNA